MNARLLKLWDLLRGSFWFLPTLMSLTALALALGSVEIDTTLGEGWIKNERWAHLVYSGGAAGASLVLSTIAGSAITIAGTVFSMTLVALSLASSQLGPRLLRNFMRDRVNQVVLGTFISTFLYCLVVLRTIRREDEDLFVPHLAVTLGVVLALTSLGVLIYFIHHVAVSIQADSMVTRVGAELLADIERLFPQTDPLARLQQQRRQVEHRAGARDATRGKAAQTGLPAGFDDVADTVCTPGDGYLQQVDVLELIVLAKAAGLQVRLERQPGQYLIKGQPLLRVWPAGRLDDALRDRLSATCVSGDQRTAVQDFEFVVCQLVEVAVRALSPGINDPFTALACIDRLGSALYRLASRDLPGDRLTDDEGALRLVMPAFSFEETLHTALTQIRQNARGSSAVHARLLETIESVAVVARRPEDRDALRRHADRVLRAAQGEVVETDDRRWLQRLHAQVLVGLHRRATDDKSEASADAGNGRGAEHAPG